MLPQPVCLVGLKFLRGWLLLEKIFLSAFPGLSKKAIRNSLLLTTNNADLIKVRDSRFYTLVANKGAEGFVESWGKGWVEVLCVEEFLENLLAEKTLRKNLAVRYKLFLEHLEHYTFFHPEVWGRSRQQFFELEYDLLETILGQDLHYSTGTFKEANDSLETAHMNTLDEIAEALHLEAGKKVLDIGCGWGAKAKYLAKKYGVSVVATTMSQKGYNAVRANCAHLDVTAILDDCNSQVFPQGLDAAYATMVIMYVRRERRRAFFKRVAEALKPKGLFFLQVFGCMDRSKPKANGLINSVFDGTSVVYWNELLEDMEGLFTVVSVKDVGKDEVLTNKERIKSFRQHRLMWEERIGKEYACMVEVAFVATNVAVKLGEIQVWNMVLCKNT